jgi:hypothetical protein
MVESFNSNIILKIISSLSSQNKEEGKVNQYSINNRLRLKENQIGLVQEEGIVK